MAFLLFVCNNFTMDILNAVQWTVGGFKVYKVFREDSRTNRMRI